LYIVSNNTSEPCRKASAPRRFLLRLRTFDLARRRRAVGPQAVQPVQSRHKALKN
jgi:hypothetical protein